MPDLIFEHKANEFMNFFYRWFRDPSIQGKKSYITSIFCQLHLVFSFGIMWKIVQKRQKFFLVPIWKRCNGQISLKRSLLKIHVAHWIRWKRFGNSKKVPSLWAVFSTNSMLFGPSHVSFLIFLPRLWYATTKKWFSKGVFLAILLVKMSLN